MAGKKRLDDEDEIDGDEEETPRKTSKKRGSNGSKKKLKDETRHTVLGVIFLALALFFVMAGFGSGGVVGTYAKQLISYLFGVGYALAPILLAILGITFMRSGRPQIARMQFFGALLLLVGSLGLIDIASGEIHGAGVIGQGAAFIFLTPFGTLGAVLFLGAALIISLVVLFDTRPTLTLFISIADRIQAWWENYLALRRKNKKLVVNDMSGSDENETEEKVAEEEEVPVLATEIDDDEVADEPKPKPFKRRVSSYSRPPLDLLKSDSGKPNVGDVKANANIIKRSLSNFGIEVEMDEVTIGPTVTRYALKPAEGVKLSRIVGLQNDLSLALAAHPIRIEAPIPGKSLVGIEIPNKAKSIVGLATLLGDEKFQNTDKALTVALGRGINGQAHFGNLAKMPHLLVAGATGSGKSVTIHSIVTSLLYRNGPEEMRFIMVDPKRVELTLYKNIPHLLTPVITDAKKAILALKWAAKEMDRRYDILESESVRDIESYHKNIVGEKKKLKDDEVGPDPMPYIVIIIDELADIMQAYPRELESAIVRLAQMSRAVGIHLLLSTQRPSVNVITGLIKANVPSRVALQVSSQIDSRTILDAGGAEKLLGAGDMLYAAGDMPQPERLQSAYISEAEVKGVVKWILEHNESDGADEIVLGGTIASGKNIFEASLEGDESEDDELYEDARITVIEAGKASTSFLQRKLGVGYARAARLIDILEERGVIGPGSGAKPRDVLVKPGDGIMDVPASLE
ncbi:MAG: DNA translocase FtsK 4TM domain-containing protein, partial [Candidatus Pacebacteria bacterium]|nr:DNA translocase FtsK 4TM domain-containing protein [Candidatus Paceibacterota bacterium]